MLVDLHLHSSNSFDSEENPENYLIAAQNAGVNRLGFSEHYDYDAHLDGEDIALADVPLYKDKLDKLRGSNPQLDILFGLEFGYRVEALPRYREIISKYSPDYVINSVHTVKGRGDCYHDKFFEGLALQESYLRYLEAVKESVCADFDYQIVGHIGYVSRYRRGGQLKYADFSEILDDILTEIIKRGKCLEINTSVGISANSFLPDCEIIERYLLLGGKLLSFGSDAHTAERFLYRGKQLVGFLKDRGVTQLYYYKNTQPIPYKI